MRHHGSDLLHPDAVRAYFTEHYWKQSDRWDARGVMDCFTGHGEVLNFRTAAERYRLIEDSQTPVVVPWGRKGRALVEHLIARDRPADRVLRRAVQRHCVGIRPAVLAGLVPHTVVEPQCTVHGEPVGVGIHVLLNHQAYDAVTGLQTDAAGADPDELIEGP